MRQLQYDVGDARDAQVFVDDLREELFSEQVHECAVIGVGVVHADGFPDVRVSHVQ